MNELITITLIVLGLCTTFSIIILLIERSYTREQEMARREQKEIRAEEMK